MILIRGYASHCHNNAEKLTLYVQKRPRGIGISTVAFFSASREDRKAVDEETHGTEQQTILRGFAGFVTGVLSFLYAKAD